MKPYRGPPMTLGNAANAKVRLVGAPGLARRGALFRREPDRSMQDLVQGADRGWHIIYGMLFQPAR